MYAVIETGGKQYRVEVGTELEVELLDAEPGSAITLERVLLVADGAEAAIGRPIVEDAAVEAEVVGRERGDKVIAFKYQPKARRRVKKGHRQELTLLRIADIRFNGKSAAEAERKSADDAKTERQRLEEAAAKQAAADAALAAKLAKSATRAADAAAAPKRGRAKVAATADEPRAEAPTAEEATAEAPTAEAPKTEAPKAEAGARKRARKAAEREASTDDDVKTAADEADEAAPVTAEVTQTEAGGEADESAGTPAKKTARAKKDE
jgi:large subunit ribosomal protein L21